MMNRRDTLTAMGLAACWTLAKGTASLAQQRVDPDFLRMWEAAQAVRPARIGSSGRIAPADEPGPPLVIRARLFDRAGQTPVAGALIFAYQTDRGGDYDRPGGDGWRLRGWARTDDQGAFEFQTIRPAPYPNRKVAAHIHVGIEAAPGKRETLLDVLFADDPLLTPKEIARSQREGRFANIRPVTKANGVETMDILFRQAGDFIF